MSYLQAYHEVDPFRTRTQPHYEPIVVRERPLRERPALFHDSQYTDIPSPPQIERERTLTYSYQGQEGTCFAHTASHIIFHNIYHLELTKEDRLLYLDNKCYDLLDTTQPEIEDAIALEKTCGKTSAIRILLFLYIYKTITNKYGCSGGYSHNTIYYFLNSPIQPSFTNSLLNDYVLSTLESVNKKLFNVSILSLDPMPTTISHAKKFLKQYFDDNYYCILGVQTPPHALTIIGMNIAGLFGKDSATQDNFIIPWEQFHKGGIFTIKTTEYRNLDKLIFVYEKTKFRKYDKEFRFLLSESNVNTEGGTRRKRYKRVKTRR